MLCDPSCCEFAVGKSKSGGNTEKVHMKMQVVGRAEQNSRGCLKDIHVGLAGFGCLF